MEDIELEFGIFGGLKLDNIDFNFSEDSGGFESASNHFFSFNFLECISMIVFLLGSCHVQQFILIHQIVWLRAVIT